MWQSIIVLEDFYDDAMAIRKMALSLDYQDHGGSASCAGGNSKQAPLSQGIVTVFSRMIGEPATIPQSDSSVQGGGRSNF